MTEGTVELLRRLPLLTPVEDVDIYASGVGGEFGVSLKTGGSGLPAGIWMPESAVRVPAGGLRVILASGNSWTDELMKGVAAAVESLLSQIIATSLTTELTQMVELDLSPLLGALEATVAGLEVAKHERA